MSGEHVGVVIVTYNSGPEIGDCLAALRDASALPIHTVVVDNASTDNTLQTVASSCRSADLIRNSSNRFYAEASNQGLRRVRGEFVLLLNPDALLPAGGIDALCAFMRKHPDAAAVAPRLVGPDGQNQYSVRQFPGLDTLWYDLTGLAFLRPGCPWLGRWRMKKFDFTQTQKIEQPMASCLLIRRSVLESVGLFDERFPMFFNDVDWCRRVAQAGHAIYFEPSITVRHTGGASIQRHKARMIWMGHTAYLQYLDKLHRRHPLRRLLVWISAPFVYLAAAVRTVWWGVVRRLF